MTRYIRSGHFRYRNGDVHWVNEHSVNRCDGGDSHSSGRVAARWQWADEDFTRPSRCKYCGQSVFFVRHNAGSVWFDDLGYPWIRHGCYDTHSSASAAMVTTMTSTAKGESTSLFGVIIEAGVDFKIRLSDGSILHSATNVNVSSFLGSVVVLVPSKNKKWIMTVIDHDGNTLLAHEIISLRDAFASWSWAGK